MTKLFIGGWFRFSPVQSRKARAMEQLSLSTVVGIVFMLWIAPTIAWAAPTFTTLASFDFTNGAFPQFSSLIQGIDGNFYGTTFAGGANDKGTVFKITRGGMLRALHSFRGTGDGKMPDAGLVQATDGNFYGTTSEGGANHVGTVFKITPGGVPTTLHSFDRTDGEAPGELVQATDGNFYGTTNGGGTFNSRCATGCGTVFKITPGGVLTTLHSFGTGDGKKPFAGLVQATDGNFYGTTSGGLGTVFKITPGGVLTTLYSFCTQTGCTDGDGPSGGLVQATDGNFYGTTAYGGSSDGCSFDCGTVFKITPGGVLTTLYSFCTQTGCTDGDGPSGGLVQATNGSFYGTTEAGGAGGLGTVFKITPGGVLTTLYSFCTQTGCTDGDGPSGGLVQATNGSFYGTTDGGGSSSQCDPGCGTVFRLNVGLRPFVIARPFYGAVGASIIILGNNVTRTTAVSFNGVAAQFTVVSSTEITATVPSGATTGKITVTTPSRTLLSNVNFKVL